MDEEKFLFWAFVLSCLLALCSCQSAPPAVIDTTGVDTVIVDLADTAGYYRDADSHGVPDGQGISKIWRGR